MFQKKLIELNFSDSLISFPDSINAEIVDTYNKLKFINKNGRILVPLDFEINKKKYQTGYFVFDTGSSFPVIIYQCELSELLKP